MIRMFLSQTSGHAKNYFRDALSKADYYINDQELNGTFNGRIAKRLGLEGKFVNKDSFEKLCDNINPKDGGSLTPRTVKDRRVGYDISFHCPKSVSIFHALSDDDTALNIFQSSVHETMKEMESDMQTRIRVQNQYDDRNTGALLWTDFIHQTARPVRDNLPDPHLHCHCFTFNVTYDEVEEKFKAGQFHNIKRDMPYYQARFHKRMADKFADKGYEIRKTKNGFELAVIPQAAIDYFSKRTNLIGQVAKEEGITDPKKLDELGARTREKKQSNLSMQELQDEWRDAMKRSGIDETTSSEVKTTDRNLTAEKSIDNSIEHVFSRASVKRERQILAEGYKYSIDNHNISLSDIDQALKNDQRVFEIQSGSQTLCTTALVLKEERKMVQLAMDGIGKVRPFDYDYKPNKQIRTLGIEQQNAIVHILTSQDRLTMIKGGAGTGKTTLIKHTIKEIEKTDKEVLLLAPTSSAAHDVLKKEGFDHTHTVARFLKDKTLQEQSKEQILWVDEAGMLGTKDMADLLDIVHKNKSRIVLSGDPRQHSAVDRGDAMRILKTVGHIPQASLETIYRQKESQYKNAVSEISKGNIATGFQQLDKMGSIKEINYKDISQTLVGNYLKIMDDKKSALVISPTREQSRTLNTAIRDALQIKGTVKKRDIAITVLDNLYMTEAQKKDPREYKKGDVIQTNQHMQGIKRGDRLTVQSTKGNTVTLRALNGDIKKLPINHPERFDVYRKRDLYLSNGDEMRVTKNSFDSNGKRLNNGTVLTITRINKKHGITAVKKSKNTETEFNLDFDFGNWDYAYCSTSHSAQGKTVDHVLINQPSVTFPASNQKQFYVSASRAREEVTIYTDDKESLLTQIQKSGDRLGATELTRGIDLSTKTIDIDLPKEKDITKTNDKDYEPEL
ncbi:MAG: MobF family relaxase [Bacteroidota bacterium]